MTEEGFQGKTYDRLFKALHYTALERTSVQRNGGERRGEK